MGITICGFGGGYLGSILDHSSFGFWGIVLSTVGSLLGIYLGYKIGNS